MPFTPISSLSFTPITATSPSAKLRLAQEEAKKSTEVANKANSLGEITKQTLLGIPQAGVDVAKDIGKGFAEFGLSAGETLPRLLSPELSTKVLPAQKIPGIGALGPLQSFQSKAAQAVQEGASVPAAVGKGTLDTFINDPVGIAFKPALLGLGVLGRVLSKNKAAKNELARVLESTVDRAPQVVDNAAAPVKLPVQGESTFTPIQPSNKYVPDEALPVIDAGTTPKDKSGLPTIQTLSPAKKGDLTYEPLAQEPLPTEIVPRETTVTDRTAPGTPDVVKPTEVQGTGELKTRGLAAGVEAKAVENDLTKTFGDLPEYQTVSMKDQAEKATQILASDYQAAKDIAMGKTAPPKGILPESVFVAVEKQAIQSGDVETLRQLATGSKLSGEATTMGQRIRTLAERNPDSPVKAINDIVKARIERAQRVGIKDVAKTKKEVAKTIKESIAKAPKENWESFINTITC